MRIGLRVKCQISLSDFNKILISSADLKKYSDIKLKKIRPVGAEFFLCGRTDRGVEANIRFSKFCESA
jgi:tRNA U38,U39,U40 pseudouridine synthase TruA